MAATTAEAPEVFGLAHGVEEGGGHVMPRDDQPRRAPDQYAALGGDADDAESGLIRERRHGNERQAAVRGARRDGAGDGVFGVGLDGGGEG